jgi:hypothetical protein
LHILLTGFAIIEVEGRIELRPPAKPGITEAIQVSSRTLQNPKPALPDGFAAEDGTHIHILFNDFRGNGAGMGTPPPTVKL